MGKRNNFAISFNGIPFYNSMIEHNKIHNRLNYNNKNQVLPELTTSITAQLNYDNVDELGVKMGFGISGGNYTTPTGGDGIGTANVGNYNN
ncbi:MAG: hypothetical protein LBG59_09000 [Candidatus Peribacteria bacterium]|jgi:hypothetical protein|nr:hypothetical protein [Candidatus Peribacteria bacterium]